MNVTLDSDDRIVVEYNIRESQRVNWGGSKLLLVQESEKVTDATYVVLIGYGVDWKLIWRGGWDSASKRFMDLVGDMDPDVTWAEDDAVITS